MTIPERGVVVVGRQNVLEGRPGGSHAGGKYGPDVTGKLNPAGDPCKKPSPEVGVEIGCGFPGRGECRPRSKRNGVCLLEDMLRFPQKVG